MLEKNVLRTMYSLRADDIVPVMEELPELLKNLGFKQLTETNATSLHNGNVVLFFNCKSNIFSSGIIDNVTSGHTINFVHAQHELSEAEEYHGYGSDHMDSNHFGKYLYKVISETRFANDENLKNAGFRPLSEASPSEMPLGCLVLLHSKGSHFTFPVIVRGLSHKFEGDHRLLYWRQSGIVVGQWDTGVIMDHVNHSFSEYEYLVLS